MKKYFPVLISAVIFSFGCNSKKIIPPINATAYYFPYRNFDPGMAYKFVNEKDSNDINLWAMHTVVDGYDTVMYTEIYNGKSVQLESLEERPTYGGTELVDFLMYYIDSTGTTSYAQGYVGATSLYKWVFDPKDLPCTYSINYTEQDDQVERTMTRTFTGDTVLLTIMGEKYHCIKFNDEYEVKRSGMMESGEKTTAYTTQSYFAPGMGLVRYEVQKPGEKRRDYVLVRTKFLDADSDL